MSKYLGDYAAGDTIDFKFTTFRPSTGAAFTLGGTPAISIYKDNGTTESTSGVTLTADFDSRTGLNHVRITTSSDGTFYANGSQFEAVITAGTVDSVSVIGACVGRFTLAAQTIKAVTNIVSANVTQINSDATAAANLEKATDGTGYNLGGGFIVAASVSGAVNSVTTGVTVASNTDKTGYSLATAPPTATQITDAVWKANKDQDSTATNWPNYSMGERVLRGESAQASVSVTGSHHIAADIHEIQPGTIVDADYGATSTYAKLATLIEEESPSVYRYTANALELAPGGGPGGGSTTVRMGPFEVRAEGQASDLPLDINKGATHGIDCVLVDAVGTGVDLTGATLSTKVYNTAGTLVATISGTATYAAGGAMTWTIPTSVTNTAGTYTATITRTTGASDTEVFGPLRIYVRDI